MSLSGKAVSSLDDFTFFVMSCCIIMSWTNGIFSYLTNPIILGLLNPNILTSTGSGSIKPIVSGCKTGIIKLYLGLFNITFACVILINNPSNSCIPSILKFIPITVAIILETSLLNSCEFIKARDNMTINVSGFLSSSNNCVPNELDIDPNVALSKKSSMIKSVGVNSTHILTKSVITFLIWSCKLSFTVFPLDIFLISEENKFIMFVIPLINSGSYFLDG